VSIRDIGGEFVLIERLAKLAPTAHADLVAGIGDDAAVIEGQCPGDDYLLVTTDMLVASSHFRSDWATAEQIGVKAVACNVSDIAAMGGTPTFMFVSLALAPQTPVAWVESLYRGMGDACRHYGSVLAGGDTTHGETTTINITLLGRVARDALCLRSHASPGDLLCVTGPLGGAAAGLTLLAAGLDPPDYLKLKHVAPTCRLDASGIIAPLANAMIDISDGLAAEVNHICDRSSTGAELVASQIPMHALTREAARQTGSEPLQWALSGGEDFELLFSISDEKLALLEQQLSGTAVVGRVTDSPSDRTLLLPDGKRIPLAGGYDHFS
jgi:thiamine-monophosphate kinase